MLATLCQGYRPGERPYILCVMYTLDFVNKVHGQSVVQRIGVDHSPIYI